MKNVQEILADGNYEVVIDFPRYTYCRPSNLGELELTINDTLAVERVTERHGMLPENYSLFSLETSLRHDGYSDEDIAESVERTQQAIDDGKASEGWCHFGIMKQATCITSHNQGHDDIICLRVGDVFGFEGKKFEITANAFRQYFIKEVV